MRRALLYILYVVVVVGLLISIVAAFHHKKVTDEKQKSPQISKQAGKSTKQTSGSATKLARPDYTPPKPSQSTPKQTTPPPTSSGQPSPSAQPNSSSQLSNSGPGEVIAIFIGATIIGTLAFSSYQRRLAASL